MAFYKTHIEKATSTTSAVPAVIVSNTDVLTNLSYLPSNNTQQQNPYALNEIVTNTNRDSGVIFPFRVEVNGKTYSYGTKNTCWTPNSFGYSNSTKWVNKKEVMNEFNTEHLWKEVYPGWYNWKTKVWENDEGTSGGASIDADVNIPIWPVLKDSVNHTFSAAKAISTTNVFGVTTNDTTDDGYGTEAIVTRYNTTGNVSFGFGAIISGDGLDTYVNRMTTPYSTNNIPTVCRLFTVRIKGGIENAIAYDNFNSTNCILKHYSFDKSIYAARIDYKKLRDNVYYIHDDKMTTLNFTNSHGKFYIQRISPMGDKMFYCGSPYPDESGSDWTADFSEATTWTIKDSANEVYNKNVMPGKVPRYNYTVEGGYTIHLAQPVFYNKIYECSFMPQNTNYYYLSATINGVRQYYQGDPTTYTDNWTSTMNYQTCVVFNSLQEFNTFESNLPSDIKSVQHGYYETGSYLYAGYDYGDGKGRMFSNMPPVRILALNYYFE